MARGAFKNNKRKPKHLINNKIKRRKITKNLKKTDVYDKTLINKNQSENNKQINNFPTSDSESDLENDNPIEQLLSTFNVKTTKNKIDSIDTDESDDSKITDEEIEDQDSDDNLIVSDKDKEELKSSGEDGIQNDKTDNITDNEDDDINDENECEEEQSENEDEIETQDPFTQHLNYDLSDDFVEALQNNKRNVHNIEWPRMGKMLVTLPFYENVEAKKSNFILVEQKIFAPLGRVPKIINMKTINFDNLYIKSQIHNYIKSANVSIDSDSSESFTAFQLELYSIINNYQDLYFTERTFKNAEEIRFVYSLHTINHILKTRTKVLHHNARLSKKEVVSDQYRDQGLVRPKVLIIVPFRNSALKIVEILINLLVPSEAGQVLNKNRFMEEFTGGEIHMPTKNPKPEDYEITFSGNCDDTFKIGIKVTKKSLKLYSDFYSSDIIIASPLGLRLVIGAEGEMERDYDYLASIEVLILDQTELFLMQNWDHLSYIIDHLHIQPKQAHGTDFSRVRTWTLNGWSRYYRQTLIFSSFALPEINAIFNRKCINYAGSVRSVNPIKIGSINNIHVQVPQVFRKFEADNVLKAIENRFEFFINKVLSTFKDSVMKNCLIYVPSYFDYVKIRNYFKKEDVSFVQICEYSKDAKIARARDLFFHGEKHFLLYSERFHYFRRIRLKGIRHVIFYQPPVFPHFYSEICNFMHEANQNKKCGSASNMTVTVIYSKYDSHQMASILGTDRLTKMASSMNNFHMFTSSQS